MQGVTEEFNKYIEIMEKKSNWNPEDGKINNPKKNSVESLINTMELAEYQELKIKKRN
jgi:hypothetical protein